MKSHVSGAAPGGEADQEARMSWIWRCVFILRPNTFFEGGVKGASRLAQLKKKPPTLSDRRLLHQAISMT